MCLASVEKKVEKLGIDPNTSRMLSARSTIWATSPLTGKSKLENFKSFTDKFAVDEIPTRLNFL